MALQLLSSQHLSLQNHETEFSIVQNIKKLLASKDRFQDARKFDDLYAKLTSSVCYICFNLKSYSFISILFISFQAILKNRKAVLELMYYLAQNSATGTTAAAGGTSMIRHSFTLPSLSSVAAEV